MIPEFAGTGLLPPEPLGRGYICTPTEIEQRFVKDLGSPEWRSRLFRGWHTVREQVGETVPSASWWIWGCFVSNHPEPVWGDGEKLSCITILPESEVAGEERALMLEAYLGAAMDNHSVDAGLVIRFDDGTAESLDTLDVLEGKWRPRATRGFADHSTRELVPAGFLEVLP
jgi:hypothetical protein